jgi:hypothetical protein
MSATCYVYKAINERDLDSEGNPSKVALKLMLKKTQFKRELAAIWLTVQSVLL